MPFYSHRRWYQPIVMGISYVNSYSFNGHMLCPLFSSLLVLTNRYGHFICILVIIFNCHMLCHNIHHGWYRPAVMGISYVY